MECVLRIRGNGGCIRTLWIHPLLSFTVTSWVIKLHVCSCNATLHCQLEQKLLIVCLTQDKWFPMLDRELFNWLKQRWRGGDMKNNIYFSTVQGRKSTCPFPLVLSYKVWGLFSGISTNGPHRLNTILWKYGLDAENYFILFDRQITSAPTH